MNIWITVQLLQAAAFLVAVMAGVLLLRLPWKLACIAGLLALPAPLLQITACTAGFVYAADILGILGVLVLLLNGQRQRLVPEGRKFFVWATAVLLLVGPAFTNLVGMLHQESPDLRHIGISTVRGLIYCSLFIHAMRLARAEKWAEDMLAVGCLLIGMVSAFGVAQFYFGFNIDLWNSVRELNPTEHTGGFGGGFMGLYRGAVGAWAATILAITPVVFFHRRAGWLITAVLSAALLGGILVTGSRQGAIFGILGIMTGLAMSLIVATGEARRRNMWNIARTFVALALIGGAAAMKGIDRSFSEWLAFRFRESLGEENLFQAGLKRETKAEAIVTQLLERPLVLIFGAGQSSIVEDLPEAQDPYALVYVDSEILWILQQGGLAQLLLYFAFLFQVASQGLLTLRTPASGNRRLVGCTTSAVIVGTGFTYGHFFLLHVQSTQSPIACWNWLVVGLGVATIMGRGRVQVAEVDEADLDQVEKQSELEPAA
jgi:hypothetical protein